MRGFSFPVLSDVGGKEIREDPDFIRVLRHRFRQLLNGFLRVVAGQGLFDLRHDFVEFGKGIRWIYAYPAFRNGEFYAAAGAGIPRSRHKAAYHRKICRILEQTAEEISRSLSVRFAIA